MVGLFARVMSDDGPLLTQEFVQAFDVLEFSSENVFLTGKAGTGKSTFLKYFREHTTKKIAVIAPTGVAALNVNGQTIHSFFRFKPSFINIADMKPIKRSVFREIELLIIDEISMVRADVLDGIDVSLRHARKNDKPFGGIQVCVIGDMFQLPPVVSREEQVFYGQFYASPFFFAAHVYAKANFRRIAFETVHRQHDDVFIGVLNAIRAGACSAQDLAVINARHIARATPAEGTIVLTATNAQAEKLNASKLDALAGDCYLYEGEVRGEFGLSGARLPAPEELELKVGAQVMFVKNDTQGRWVNGTLGQVVALADDGVTVRVGEQTFDVEPEKWQALGYDYDEAQNAIVEKTMGSYKQFPLMLAWAITIHKSQGKTLERVIIDLGHGAFASGQLYVALSRCKTLQGIALKQPVSMSDVRCDKDVIAFMNAPA